MILNSIIISVFLIQCIIAGPVVIRSNIIKDQGQQLEQNANVYDGSSNKGISNFEENEGFNIGDERKHVTAEDSGQYGEQNSDKKHHLQENSEAAEKFHKQGGGSVSDFGNKFATKKGHHRSGFHNSYHKDESGNNSSFYDDSDDLEDAYAHKTQQGTYGDLGSRRNQGHYHSGSDYDRENGKRGGYQKSGTYGNDQGNKRKYNHRLYSDDKQNQGISNAANRYGENGRHSIQEGNVAPHYPNRIYTSNQYYPKPEYYTPPVSVPVALPPRKTITIYEDPRIYEGGEYTRTVDYEPEYDSDYIHLDIRAPPRDSRLQTSERYYEPKKSVYNDYYYY